MTEARMIIEISLKLFHFFEGDMEKVESWLNFENRNLGGCKPIDLIKNGKTKKLYQFTQILEWNK